MTPETAPKPACYPVHPVRRFIANTSDSCKPRAIRIGGWRNADGEWHCWERPLWTSGYRSTHAASIWMNGCGRDHEVRWVVSTILPHEPIDAAPNASVVHWAGNFSQQDKADHLAACGGAAKGVLSAYSRFYPGRGIQHATAEDVVWLMGYCDRKLEEIYGDVWNKETR